VVGIGQKFVIPPFIISKGVMGSGLKQGVKGALNLCLTSLIEIFNKKDHI
jgi:hypothetical protein